LQNSNINVTLGRPCSSPPLRRPPTPTQSLPVTRPPPAVHQIEYVRTNATKTQLSKTYEKTYNKRDPQPTRCTPMRIYAHTMRMPTSPCQHKLFNKSGLANVQNDSGFRLQRASDTCNAILQPNCLEHNYQGNVRANQPTNQPIPGQCPVHLCASMRTLCACPRTLMPTIFVKQPLMPPTVHQIEYVRTNATKTQLSKTHKRTYETRDPQPTRCKPMRIYAHTMRIPTSPCQHKLFNKYGLANVQTI
jgi:hypothetical protein